MTKPLALAHFDNLVVGNQLANRLEQTGYRVSVVADATRLPECAQKEMPLIVIVEVSTSHATVNHSIQSIKAHPATQHIPILAFAGAKSASLLSQAREAGANLVANDSNILVQLPLLLDQVLQMD
jgi:PleD family two-component response regulator